MLFYLGCHYDGNARARVAMCSKACPQMKTLFARCGGLVLPPLNNMEKLPHISNGGIEDVAIETLKPLVEGEFVSTSQVEGARNFTLVYK
jgi:hypothetical protein